mmetsp:Transcript_107265/g.218879  ORF Transcript_107265/g.218879 Transcript_107265/m.218879 type:complete len:221 (+) Transcript_107265:32-694(+)
MRWSGRPTSAAPDRPTTTPPFTCDGASPSSFGFKDLCRSSLALRLEVLACTATATAGLGCLTHLRRLLRLTLGRGSLLGRSCRLLRRRRSPRLRLLGCGFLGRLAELRLLRLLFLDVVQRHADDGLLELLRLPGALLRLIVHLAFLVHLSPSLGPAQLHRLDALVEQRVDLTADEERWLAIPGDEPLAAAWVDAVLGVGAEVSLDHHGLKARNLSRMFLA